VAEIGDNNKGYRGAVMNAATNGIKLHIGKGLKDSGGGSSAGVLEAVDQCINAGARIISMSLGGSAPSSAEETVYKRTYEDEGILIVAAGKSMGSNPSMRLCCILNSGRRTHSYHFCSEPDSR
jgi:serine protease